MKKLFAIITTLAVIAMVVPNVGFGEETVEDLQAQIAALLAQIQTLQNQLSGLNGTTPVVGVPAACAGVSFTRNLSTGVTGNDVKCLQALLNQSPDTQVAAAGVGSSGNETMYFGPLTRAAVVKFQNKYASEVLTPIGLTAGTGFVGTMTRAKLNAMLTAAPTTPTTPTTPEDPVDGITTPGKEGTITATTASTPATAGEVYITETDKEIMGVNIKAEGSDVLLNRMDINFTGMSGTNCNVRPWTYFSKITVTDGTTSKSVNVTEANTTEVTVGSEYFVRVPNLGILVSDGTTKKVTIKVDVASALTTGATECTVTYQIKQNAFRATDGAGISQYAPSTASLAARTVIVKTGDAATLEISANANNPKARNVAVSESAKTLVELLRVDVKAKNNAAILRTVGVVASSTSSNTIATLYLYDGDTLLGSTSTITAATSWFEEVDLTIPKDTTKTLIVKGDINKTEGNYAEGDGDVVKIEASGDAFQAEDASIFSATAVSGDEVEAGQPRYYIKSPSLALVDTSITSVSVASGSAGTNTKNNQADGKIKINVTAVGGNIYIASSTTNDQPATTTIAGSATISASISSNATVSDQGNFLIYSGETKWVEVTGRIALVNYNDASETSQWTNMSLTNLHWAITDAGASDPTVNQTWGLSDFKTGNVYLEAFDN